MQADVLTELLGLFYERMQEEGKDKYLRPREKTSLLLGEPWMLLLYIIVLIIFFIPELHVDVDALSESIHGQTF